MTRSILDLSAKFILSIILACSPFAVQRRRVGTAVGEQGRPVQQPPGDLQLLRATVLQAAGSLEATRPQVGWLGGGSPGQRTDRQPAGFQIQRWGQYRRGLSMDWTATTMLHPHSHQALLVELQVDI